MEQLQQKKENIQIPNKSFTGLNNMGMSYNELFPMGFFPAYILDINYENLLATYNNLYGDRTKLTIPDEEKNKTYKIELPDGKVEEITGKDLYKAKFRYVTTQNGDIQIKITNNENNVETITYEGITNIDECVIYDGDYIYTYNCLPFLDDGIKYIIDAIDESDAEEIMIERCIIYRFNLGGWNACLNLKKIFEEQTVLSEPCKTSINGEPITSMIATYISSELNFEPITIPDTVKYMFDTFRYGKLPEKTTEIVLPKSVEYISFPYMDSYDTGNIIFKVPKSIKSFAGANVKNGLLDEYISSGAKIELYD